MDQTLTLHWQERRLGRTLLRTYRDTVDLYDVFPNEKQPRMGPKEDPELQMQIEANEGIFEPLLLEPHPDSGNRYRIIDGDRRWTNSKILVEVQKKEQYRFIPAEITDRTLTEDERLRVWIYIHRQRREWDAKEKEMVAYSLVNMVGRASAANILGITVRELDKLVEIYDLSEKLTNLAEPGGKGKFCVVGRQRRERHADFGPRAVKEGSRFTRGYRTNFGIAATLLMDNSS